MAQKTTHPLPNGGNQVEMGILLPPGISEHSRDVAVYKVSSFNNLLRKMPINKPYADTRLSRFIDRRVLEIKHLKSQADVAAEAGFINANMMSMVKSGSARLPIDRVPALAKALDVDPARLMHLTLEQMSGDTIAWALMEIFGTAVTRNEVVWLNEIRDASGHVDPALTSRARSAIRGIFGK